MPIRQRRRRVPRTRIRSPDPSARSVLVRFLRLQSSVQFFPSRTALADIDIAGTTIPKGAPIFLVYGAGNRGPWRVPDANRFDPERKYNEHIGWAAGFTSASAVRSHAWR